MPDTTFKTFLSCSFAPEDRSLIDLFKRLLEALNLGPVVYDKVEVQGLTSSVESLIRGCDCFVAIATRRSRIAGTGEWTPPDWIHQEIAFARAHGRPIALFVEQGVRFSGFAQTEVRRLEFSRDTILEGVHSVIAYLYSLRRTLDEAMGARDRLKQITFTRESVRIREEFTRNHLAFTCDVTMEALEDVPHIYHSSVLDDDTPGLTIHPDRFEFRCRERPPGVEVTTSVIQDTRHRHVWAIHCAPALGKGQKLRYGFRLAGANYRPFGFEEMQARLEAKTYAYTKPVCNALDWTITHPTRELIYDIDFPADYEIEGIELQVMIGHSANEDEVKRIKTGNGLQIEKLFDAWAIRLKVQNPLYGHNYGITYRPPKLSG